MTDLNNVAMFCLFYSGVVMYSLWLTIGRTQTAKVFTRNRR
ncbi:MAG TPA: hypothetical protein VF412_18725 [Bdellovibrio sp.]